MRGTIFISIKISRQVLVDNSQPFKAEFTGNRWAEADASTVDMETDNVNSVEVVLRVLHNSLTDDLYTIGIRDVWEVIQYCDYREISVSKMSELVCEVARGQEY